MLLSTISVAIPILLSSHAHGVVLNRTPNTTTSLSSTVTSLNPTTTYSAGTTTDGSQLTQWPSSSPDAGTTTCFSNPWDTPTVTPSPTVTASNGGNTSGCWAVTVTLGTAVQTVTACA